MIGRGSVRIYCEQQDYAERVKSLLDKGYCYTSKFNKQNDRYEIDVPVSVDFNSTRVSCYTTLAASVT